MVPHSLLRCVKQYGSTFLPVNNCKIVHYDTSAMKRFLTSVSLQHEPKARNFIFYFSIKWISAREACVKPHFTHGVMKNHVSLIGSKIVFESRLSDLCDMIFVDKGQE